MNALPLNNVFMLKTKDENTPLDQFEDLPLHFFKQNIKVYSSMLHNQVELILIGADDEI